jgi:hypothetical protein
MAPLHVPVFVLAPSGVLPLEPSGWGDLAEAQRRSFESGRRLRMYRVHDDAGAGLEQLIASEVAGQSPFCDALVPDFRVDSLSLGIYEARGHLSERRTPAPLASIELETLRCLDQVPLQEVQNEACWFYPTEDGSYLCWSNRRQVRSRLGRLPDRPPTTEPLAYRRDRLRLLWSLMADEEQLTCVGLTYNHQRIDWPLEREEPHPSCSWTWFRIDSTEERPYREVARCSVPVN